MWKEIPWTMYGREPCRIDFVEDWTFGNFLHWTDYIHRFVYAWFLILITDDRIPSKWQYRKYKSSKIAIYSLIVLPWSRTHHLCACGRPQRKSHVLWQARLVYASIVQSAKGRTNSDHTVQFTVGELSTSQALPYLTNLNDTKEFEYHRLGPIAKWLQCNSWNSCSLFTLIARQLTSFPLKTGKTSGNHWLSSLTFLSSKRTPLNLYYRVQ